MTAIASLPDRTAQARPYAVACGAVLLAAVAAIHYRLIFSWLPVDPDQLIAMSFGTRPSATAILLNQLLDYLPGYRPLFGLSFWLQYQMQGIEHVAFYYAVNLVLLWGIATMVFAVVLRATGRIDAAFIAAAAALIDDRNHVALIWLDRQISMAAFFGFAGVMVLYRDKASRVSLAVAAVLSLLGAISKEYGLAFIGLVGLEALYQLVLDRRNKAAMHRLAIGIVVAAVYFAMRIGLAGGASGNYCETEGFFWQSAEVCFNRDTLFANGPQWLYNISAAFVGAFLPGLFNGDGKLAELSHLSPAYMLYGALFAAFSIYAIIRGSRVARMGLVLIACSAVISFVLFRHRNHMVGQVGLYVSAGIGLAMLLDRLRAARFATAAKAAVLGLTVVLMLGYAYRTEAGLHVRYDELLKGRYCDAIAANRSIDAQLARALDARYRPSIAPCP